MCFFFFSILRYPSHIRFFGNPWDSSNSSQTVHASTFDDVHLWAAVYTRDISKSTIQAGNPPARAPHRSLIAYLAKSKYSTPKGRPACGRCSPERLFPSLECTRALHSMAQVWLSRALHLLFPGTPYVSGNSWRGPDAQVSNQFTYDSTPIFHSLCQRYCIWETQEFALFSCG